MSAKATDVRTMSREQLEAYCDALEAQIKSLSEEADELRDDLDEMRERAEDAEAERDEAERDAAEEQSGRAPEEVRRWLHILYHDFAEALDGWRRIALHIRRDGERAFEALRTGGNTAGRIHDIVRWAGAVERKTGEQAAALGLMREIAEAVTGESLYLLDDIDD